jgi:hypothetical protein
LDFKQPLHQLDVPIQGDSSNTDCDDRKSLAKQKVKSDHTCEFALFRYQSGIVDAK